MNKLKKLFPVLLLAIISVLTIFFRYIPKRKIWKEYKIIYVAKNCPAQEVELLLQQEGINDFVCLENQRIPIMLTKNSPEETMLKLNISSSENQYIYERNNYFYDSKGEYSVYYIPQKYSGRISAVLNQLKKSGYTAGADAELPYLIFLPVIVVALAVLLTVFSKNKAFMLLSAVSPCIYIFCNAFYCSAISVIILLLCIFIISNVLGRKGAVQKLVKHIILIVALVISVISSFSMAFLPGLFYLLCIGGALCGALISQNLKAFRFRKTEFAPVFIRSASKVSVYGTKSKLILPLTLAASVLVFVYFAVGSSSQTGIKSDSSLLLPGAVSQADYSGPGKLPEIEDFFRWNWNVLISPYKSLNDNCEYDDEHIVYPRYEQNDGIITRINQVMYYDKAFKEQIYDGIDQLDFNSIESVIKSEGPDFVPGYTKSGSYNISIFSIIMMIMGFFVLLFIYFSAMIGKRGRR